MGSLIMNIYLNYIPNDVYIFYNTGSFGEMSIPGETSGKSYGVYFCLHKYHC